MGVKIEKLVWHFFLQSAPIFFSQKGRLLSPKQKVFWQLCDYLRFWGSKSHFFQKNAFFGQKMTFFQKIYFIQNWSGIKTTSCAHTKKYIFKIKLWPCNFHQILPKHTVSISLFRQVVWGRTYTGDATNLPRIKVTLTKTSHKNHWPDGRHYLEKEGKNYYV